MRSQQFRGELFTQPGNFEEGPLRDRKEIIPNLRHHQEKAEFLRDVVSLANSARMLGRPAYLLLGIDDDGHPCDLTPSLEPYRKRARRKAEGREWDEHRFEECLWREVIERQMLKEIIAGYVNPALAASCRLEYGRVRGSLCAYLLIPQNPSPKPYQLRKTLKSSNNVLLNRGQCWIRIGESKHEIEPREIAPNAAPYCYAFTQVPYLLPSEWLNYFGRMMDRQFYQAYNRIPGYQDLPSTTEKPLNEIVNEFLSSTESKLLVIRGKAGTGKSVFLRRLIYNRAESGGFETEQNIQQQRFSAPTSLIPVYMSLRGWQMRPGQALDDQIMDCLNATAELWCERPRAPESMLDHTGYNWLLCLDGLDEIWSLDDQRSFVNALTRFQERHPAIRVILTTRPDVTVAGLSGALVVDVGPLTPEQIQSYLGANAEGEQIEEIMEFLQLEPELWDLCSVPAFLEAATTAWIDEFYPPAFEESGDISSDASTHIPVEPVIADAAKAGAESKPDEVLRFVQESLAGEIEEEGTGVELANGGRGETLNFEDVSEKAAEEFIAPIRTGRVLHRIYQHVWNRERHRRPVDASAPGQWFDGTAELAAWLDGNRRNVRLRRAIEFFAPQQGLYWVLSLGVLERALRGGWIRFVADITRTYFAASFVLPFVEEGDYEEPLAYIRQGKRRFWEDALAILGDLIHAVISLLEEETSRLAD